MIEFGPSLTLHPDWPEIASMVTIQHARTGDGIGLGIRKPREYKLFRNSLTKNQLLNQEELTETQLELQEEANRAIDRLLSFETFCVCDGSLHNPIRTKKKGNPSSENCRVSFSEMSFYLAISCTGDDGMSHCKNTIQARYEKYLIVKFFGEWVHREEKFKSITKKLVFRDLPEGWGVT